MLTNILLGLLIITAILATFIIAALLADIEVVLLKIHDGMFPEAEDPDFAEVEEAGEPEDIDDIGWPETDYDKDPREY